MANEQYAFLDKAQMLQPSQWQLAISESGFDLVIDPKLNIEKDSGFIPCKLYGTESGVEINFVAEPVYLNEFKDIAPDANYYVSFRWGGDLSECACAMILSYALAKKSGAMVSYECEGPYEDLEAFESEIKDVLRDLKFIPRD